MVRCEHRGSQSLCTRLEVIHHEKAHQLHHDGQSRFSLSYHRELTHAPFAEVATVSARQQQMPNHPGGLFLLLGQVLCPYQKQQLLNQKGTGCLVRTDSASDGSANTHAVVP